MKKVILLISVLCIARFAAAGLWNPAQNGIFPPDAGYWNDPGNWGEIPGCDSPVVFNLADQAACWIDNDYDACCGTLRMGDNGAESPHNSVLRLLTDATLTVTGTSTWSAVGYSRKGNTVIVERDALWDIDAHLYLGMNGTGSPEASEGTVIVNGGTVLIADTFRYGREPGAEGYVYLNAGLFQARYLNSVGPSGGLFDISFGKYRLTGGEDSDRDRLQRDIDNGYVSCFGGAGTPIVAREPNGDWYVICDPDDDPLARIPIYDAYVMANPALELSWVNLPSDPPGGDVEVDVWFGTDPTWDPDGNYIDFTKIVDHGVNTTSAIVDASISMQEYVWRVDTYGTNAADPNAAAEGIMMYFTAVADPQIDSVIVDTPSMVTWVNEPVSLEATIVDDGVSDVTVTWSTDEADPNETWTDQVTVIPAGSMYPVTVSATVAIDYPAGEVVVTATAADSSSLGGTVTDSVSIYVFENRCLATQELAGMPPPFGPYDRPGDINKDCVIDLEDLAILVSYWTVDYSLSGPTAIIP